MTKILPEFKVIDILQDSPRFLVQKVSYKGSAAVFKWAKTAKMATNLEYELLAYQVYDLMTQQSGCPFKVTSVLGSGDDWILLDFISGKTMSELMVNSNKTELYKQLASIMAFCDNKVKLTFDDSPIKFTQFQLKKNRSRLIKIKSNLVKLDQYDAEFLRGKVEQATEYYLKNSPDLQTCFVNADLTPSHVMISEQGPVIFDFENVRLFGARFSDVINVFTKIWFLDDDKDLAQKFYNSFWEQVAEKPQAYSQQIKTLVALRCVGFTDELLTSPNQYHNTKLSMTPQYAKNIEQVYDWANSI